MSEKSDSASAANNLEYLIEERFLIAELGHPNPDMPDYDQYPSDAIVPLEPRSLRTHKDIALLKSRFVVDQTSPPDGVAIVRPRDLSHEQLRALQDYAAQNAPGTKGSHLREGRTRTLTTDIPNNLWMPHGTILPYATNKNDEKVPNSFVLPSEPGMRTTTQVPGLERPRIGLHLDRWFQAETAEECSQAPGRFGLNLGPGDRSVIIGCSMFDIGREIGPQRLGESRLEYTRRYNSWRMHNGRPLSAIIGKVLVGEGYTNAKTEFVLHDGSTLGFAKGADQSQAAFWIGRFIIRGEKFQKHFELVA